MNIPLRYSSTRNLAKKILHSSKNRNFYQRAFSSIILTVAAGSTNSIVCCEAEKDDWISQLQQIAGGKVDIRSKMDGFAKDFGSNIQSAIDSGIPTQISYGFVMGYCSGLALKKVGKAVAVVVGGGFIVLQGLQHAGYVHVDHTKFKEQIEGVLDLNKDGIVDKKDASIAFNKIQSILTVGVPSGGGFCAGFIGGLRSR
mmetsp:Transcript_19208/g.21967  ORF Transcript_19208/g.21967 Transcript_19208/m.21967 type:complete len:199 (-) Transcript_19208:162-758(-)|eukprot:CAMPEP_0194147244 /NCGR_PEP_ID=MMETSP0152-20130528/22608_1 /TAXON_ID=1049557 /ORGANISM="Thalassiothrix antarctica, Strain L6-D1" /LENGTH=198 /DNA_ID=CAMNT_0038847963 /DNA_START=44 /DNA_END=640 /DNA_ORIENTATION=-